MCKKYLLICILMGLLLGYLNEAFAWDDYRKGFILGFGGGTGFTAISRRFYYTPYDHWWQNEVNANLCMDFKIGYAPTDQVLLYYSLKTAWYVQEDYYGEAAVFTNNYSTFGMSYYIEPDEPSPYICGGIGLNLVDIPRNYYPERNNEQWGGPGFFVGAGFEFVRHLNLEVVLAWGTVYNEDLPADMRIDTASLFFTLNLLGY